MKLCEFKKIVKEHLSIEDPYLLEVVLSVVLGIEISGEPLWMFLIAPPGGTKTELCRCLKGDSKIYTISTLTPHSLISGLKTNKKDIDLMPLLNGKVLVIKDFTSILTKRDVDRNEIFGQLREGYDGYLEAWFGSGIRKKSYSSRFGLLAAVTPVIDAYQTMNSLLGERFLKYRVITNEGEAIAKAGQTLGEEDGIRREISLAFSECLRHYRTQIKNTAVSVPKEINEPLQGLANITAKLRSPVPRNHRGEIRYSPEPEIGTRLVKQLKKLVLALTYLHEVPETSTNEYEIVKRVAIHTIPGRRLDLIKEIGSWPADEDPTARDIATPIRMPASTCLQHLEDLWLLGLVSRTGKNPYYWSLTKLTKELLNESQLL